MARRLLGPPSTDVDRAVTRGLAQTLITAAVGGGIRATRGLGILRAGLAVRTVRPCRLVFAGSSTTSGSVATTEAKRYVNQLVTLIQAQYPSGAGSEQPTVTSDTATFGTLSNAPGVHGYNAGDAGTGSGNYLTAGERTSIAALAPTMVMHMVGANDFAGSLPVATYKANLLASIDDLRSKMTTPCVHVLVHTYQRSDSAALATATIPWAAYGQALAELAAAFPEYIAFVDLSPAYEVVGVPGSDPFDVISTDTVHQNDAGHAMMTDLLFTALLELPRNRIAAAGPDTTVPVIASFTATPGSGQNVLTWAGSDNVGVTRWVVTRGGTTVYDGTATSVTDTGLTNGTSYSYVLTAYDAAGNTATANATATPVASGPTPFFTDTLTAADGTKMTARASDSGQTWTMFNGTADGATIASNRAYGATTGTDRYAPVVTPPSANYKIRPEVLYLGGSQQFGAGLRLTGTSSRTGYYAVFNVNAVQVNKVVAGTVTQLASPAVTLTAGKVYALEVSAVGTTLTVTVTVDGTTTQLYSGTDTSVTAVGTPYIYWGPSAGSTTTGWHLDAITATAL